MFVKAFKTIDVEIDVSINIEHVTSVLLEALEECSQEVDQRHLATVYVNRIHQCLSGMPDALIAAMRPEHRQIVCEEFRKQAERFRVPSPLTPHS